MPESTDVLVVGGGTAACMAAIEAAVYGVRVTLVDKGLMGRGGSSPTGDAAMSAAFGHTSLEGDIGQDNEAQHYEDTMRRGEWLAHPTLVAVMAREAMERLDELETLGVRFSRTGDKPPLPVPDARPRLRPVLQPGRRRAPRDGDAPQRGAAPAGCG